MSTRSLTRPVVLAVTLSLLTTPVLQAQQRVAPAEAIQIRDVSLNAQGQLVGQIVDGAGKKIDAAQVAVYQNAKLVHRGVTDMSGAFQVAGLKSGVYRVDCPGNSVTCRIWNPAIAPPTSKDSLVMVGGDAPVRGQMGMFDPVTCTALLLGIAGVTLSAISVSKLNDLDDKIDRLHSP